MIAFESSAGFVFGFETDDVELRSILHRCFDDLRVDKDPLVVFTMFQLRGQRTLVRVVGEPEISCPDSILLEEIVTIVNRQALEHDSRRLHLHAAGLSLGDRGVLMAAEAGTGKSTLAAALVDGGFTYLSDESVSIDVTGEWLEGFPKPITLRQEGARLLGDISAAAITIPDTAPERTHLPVAELGGQTSRQARSTVAVLLKREVGRTGAPLISRLSPADAVIALLGHTQDFERFGADGLLALSNLAATCACYEFEVGGLDENVSAIRNLLETAENAEKMLVERAPSFLNIETVEIGNEVVLLNSDNGVAVHLPADSALHWLKHMHGESSGQSEQLLSELEHLHVIQGEGT